MLKGGFRRFPTRACQKQAQSEEAKPDEGLCSTNGVAFLAINGIAHCTNLGFCSDAVGTIDPDVFG